MVAENTMGGAGSIILVHVYSGDIGQGGSPDFTTHQINEE